MRLISQNSFKTLLLEFNNLNSQLKQTTLGGSPSVFLLHSCKGGVEFTLQHGVNHGVNRL
jgi:hypothetical protein